jgi:hypothetical protein
MTTTCGPAETQSSGLARCRAQAVARKSRGAVGDVLPINPAIARGFMDKRIKNSFTSGWTK